MILTERELFNGYRRADPDDRLEARRCACGGTVTADPDAPMYGVRLHQRTARHVAWRKEQGHDD